MAKDYSILIGTVGQGLGVSADGGETWTKIRQPIPSESNVRGPVRVSGQPTPGSGRL